MLDAFDRFFLGLLRDLLLPWGARGSDGGNTAYSATPGAVTGLSPMQVVQITVTSDCFYRFTSDGTNASAADRMLLRGTYKRIVPPGCDRVSFVRRVSDGYADVQRIRRDAKDQW